MARLGSEAKMGYYPTPLRVVVKIASFFKIPSRKDLALKFLDPCCGEGNALDSFRYQLELSEEDWPPIVTYGVEMDFQRGAEAARVLDHVVSSSIFDVRIDPPECMGLVWLNPPYGSEGGERYELSFLRQSLRWLAPKGVLVYIVPERLFENEKIRLWIGKHFCDCQVYRFPRNEFPKFKQVVLLGKKRADLKGYDSEDLPTPPYPYIEDIERKSPGYLIPATDGPSVFQGADVVKDDEIHSNRARVIEEVKKLMGREKTFGRISPLLPLRKGHLVALLAAGFLDGRVEDPEGAIWIKGFTERIITTRQEDDREITRHTYRVGIRVIEEGGKWYDIS